MTEYKTLRVPKDAYEKAQEARQEYDDTWGEYLRRCAENPPVEVTVVDSQAVTEDLQNDLPEKIAEEVRNMHL
jgi:hypothetical protein